MQNNKLIKKITVVKFILIIHVDDVRKSRNHLGYTVPSRIPPQFSLSLCTRREEIEKNLDCCSKIESITFCTLLKLSKLW